MTPPSAEPLEWWLYQAGTLQLVTSQSPPTNLKVFAHVVERKALDAALAETKLLKRQLADYEHECETINEMRILIEAERALSAKYRSLLQEFVAAHSVDGPTSVIYEAAKEALK